MVYKDIGEEMLEHAFEGKSSVYLRQIKKQQEEEERKMKVIETWRS